MIPVTKSFLPPIEKYMAHVQRAYNNGWLTNRGELVKELEIKITDYLELIETRALITNNGTIPLQLALKLLGKGGEIITTPFSYVATTAAIVWENSVPVFVDIDPISLTIDVSKIEEAITPRTRCILATHVFGNPCDVEAINIIAQKYSLKVIYDAAHCFGVKYMGKSIFEYGDVSTCSFHATKIFHTGEGGAIFCKDPDLYHKLFYSHNFGHNGPLEFYGLGINGKISELQAAMGLAVYPYLNVIFDGRKKACENYDKLIDFSYLNKLNIRDETTWNYSYYPVLFESENDLLKVESVLVKNSIFPRRYFFPSLNGLNYVNRCSAPVSESVTKRILCLPLYNDIDIENQIFISECINNTLK